MSAKRCKDRAGDCKVEAKATHIRRSEPFSLVWLKVYNLLSITTEHLVILSFI